MINKIPDNKEKIDIFFDDLVKKFNETFRNMNIHLKRHKSYKDVGNKQLIPDFTFYKKNCVKVLSEMITSELHPFFFTVQYKHIGQVYFCSPISLIEVTIKSGEHVETFSINLN